MGSEKEMLYLDEIIISKILKTTSYSYLKSIVNKKNISSAKQTLAINSKSLTHFYLNSFIVKIKNGKKHSKRISK